MKLDLPTEDSQMDTLLDEALGVEDIPDGLSDRVFARTAPFLPSPEIAGQVGFRSSNWQLRRIAASLALILGVGWVVLTGSHQNTSTPDDETLAQDIQTILNGFSDDMTLADASFDQQLDTRINQLRAEIALAESMPVEVMMGHGAESALMQAEWQDFVEETKNQF